MSDPLIDRDELAAALHSGDHGWNCGHHGVMESIHRQRYQDQADAAVYYLRSVLTPEALDDPADGAWLTSDLIRRIFGEDK